MKNSDVSERKYWKHNSGFLFFSAGWLLMGSALADNLVPNLFTWTTATPNAVTQQNLSPRSEVTRRHFAQLHLNRMADASSLDGVERIKLNLFDDVLLTAVKDRLERRSLTEYSWFGHIADAPHSQVILTVEQGSMAGNVTIEDERYGVQGTYQIRPAPEGLHEIRQIDQSVFQEGNAAEGKSDYIPVFTPMIDLPPGSQADDGSTIDVMVLYTDTAAAATANIAAEVQLGVDETNQSYINSGINQRIRLAHKAQVSYPETGNLCGGTPNDLGRLQGKTDGYLDNIHGWRDTYAADIVSLWVENGGGFCGCGYFMSNVSAAFAENAFNVVARNCATGYYSFGHEMGHNMGAMHDWYVDNGIDPYAYAHGYVNTANKWRTIMAYNDKCTASGFNCTRIQYWSNPEASYGGSPVGIAEGQSQAADNRKALNNTAYTVANFRAGGGPSPSSLLLAGLTANGQIYYTANLSTWTRISGQLNQLQIGDLNHDGQNDLVGLTTSGHVYYTTNLGTWTQVPGGLSQLQVGDLNGDGHADLAGLAGNGSIWYTTNLSSWTQVPGGLAQLRVGDLNGDGQADLAGLAGNGSIWYTTNLSSWTQVPGGLAQLQVGDFNGDGHADLAGLAGNGSIWYTTNLSAWTQVPGGLAQLQVGDLNGDGHADLAGLAGNGSIWYTTNLSAWTQVPGGLARLRVGDLNGDGKADLAGLAGNGSIWYTTNLSTWTQIPGQLNRLAGDD